MRDPEKFFSFHTRLPARHVERLRDLKVRLGLPIERTLANALDAYLPKLEATDAEVKAETKRRA